MFSDGIYNAETDAIAGPLSADNPDKKVILCNGDWLSAKNDLLWSGENAQGPCPDGWKVPSRADFQALIADYGTKTNPTASDRRWKSTGSNGDLYFVSGGYFGIKSTSTTLPDLTGNNGVVWASDVSGNNAYFWYLDNSGNHINSTITRQWALPVRCIQQ
ncbi:MAG: hypothetical protein LBK65_02270 [Tannerellaceae bacterium]|nr:hypothetical protein [Tannerellaceae bacterium]